MYRGDSYTKRVRSRVSESFVSHSAAPLTGVIAGLIVLHWWYSGLAAFLTLTLFATVRMFTTSIWTDRLSAVVGISLYCILLYLFWTLAGRLEDRNIADLLAGVLLIFLSLMAWVSSLLLKCSGVWVSRGITGVTLAGAVVILGGLVRGMG